MASSLDNREIYFHEIFFSLNLRRAQITNSRVRVRVSINCALNFQKPLTGAFFVIVVTNNNPFVNGLL